MLEQRLSLENVIAEREKLARAEYVRGLINTRQIVINRAYLYNNPVVFKDYLTNAPARDAFKQLLSAGVIVPYLFKETIPHQKPDFTADPRGFPAWEEVCKEVPTRCVRLSWDDDENQEYAREQLARRFHDVGAGAYAREISVYLRALGLPPEGEDAFRRRLAKLARACLNIREKKGRHASREDLYGQFVTADGTPPSEGKYDRSKPFAGAIKQLLDLQYNVNLPDALGGFALTPRDSPPRTALQEWEGLKRENNVSADQLMELLRRTAFSLLQEGLYMASFGELTLDDVAQLRRTDEWAQYILAMERLVKEDLSAFADPEKGAPAVYQSYEKVIRLATDKITAGRADARHTKWQPIVEVVFDVAGTTLSVIWGGLEGVLLWTVAGKISPTIGARAAPLVGRLLIRGFTEHGSQADLATSIDFLRGRLDHAKEQWKDVIGEMETLKNAKRLDTSFQLPQAPTVNQPVQPDA
jgi:hypothetical protein